MRLVVRFTILLCQTRAEECRGNYHSVSSTIISSRRSPVEWVKSYDRRFHEQLRMYSIFFCLHMASQSVTPASTSVCRISPLRLEMPFNS